MRRRVFLPFLLAVLVLPAIVGAADQNWISLLGGPSREFKADTDATLHFPITLKDVKANNVSIKLRDIRLGDRGDLGLRGYFEVSPTIVQDPQQGPVIKVAVKLKDNPPQGTYKLLIEASTSSKTPENLEITVVHPAATLKAPPEKVVLQMTKFPIWEPKFVAPPVSLTETSGKSRLEPLKVVKPVFSNAQGETPDGGLDLPDSLKPIPAGGNLTLKYQPTGDFPLGSFTGEAQLTSPQLAQPFILKFELKNSLGAWIIIPLLIIGLVIGWLSRTFLSYQVELNKARLEGGRVLAQMALQIRRIPDIIFKEKLQKAETDLTDQVLKGKDPKAIINSATEADTKLRDALTDFEQRRIEVQKKLVDFVKLFDIPWWLPPEVKEVLTELRSTLTEARDKLAARDAEGARIILEGPDPTRTEAGQTNQPVSMGLESALSHKLQGPVSEWKGKAQISLETLANSELPLPAPLTRALNEAIKQFKGLDKVGEIQPDHQIIQIIPVIQAISEALSSLRSLLSQVRARFDQTRRQFHDILSPLSAVNQTDLDTLTGKIDQFLDKFSSAIADDPIGAIDMLDGAELYRLDDDWQKFLKDLASSRKDSDEQEVLYKLTEQREYVGAARKFAEFAATPEQLKKTRKGLLAEPTPGEVSPFIWLQETLFPTAMPLLPDWKDIPPALATFLTKTKMELAKASILQTLIFGIIIVGTGYFFFREKFVGTLVDCAAVFLWGYGLDVSMNTVVDKIKSVKIPGTMS